MTQGLLSESGKFRGGDVGVFDGDAAIHIGARPQYYKAIEDAREANDSGGFIAFTLSAMYEILAEQSKRQVKHEDKHQVDLSDTQMAVLQSLKNKTLPRKEIFAEIDMNGDSRSFRRHIEPLIEIGFIEMTVPDKPNSRLQKYRLTEAGKIAVKGSKK